MKRLHAAQSSCQPKPILHITQWPCTQEELLTLQDFCLTPGVHRIQVKNSPLSHTIAKELLEAFDYFEHVAILKTSDCIGDTIQESDFIWLETTQQHENPYTDTSIPVILVNLEE